MKRQDVLEKIMAAYNNIKAQHDYHPLTQAVELIKQIILKDRIQNLYVSFNGGKDATVATFLTFLALKELNKPVRIKCLYFQQPESFEEMEQFIQEIRILLNLNIFKLTTKQYQKQLTEFNKVHPLEWVVMGSRKDDPGCANLTEISDSDVYKGYPAFKRVNPLINWSCTFLWRVIQELGLPYCRMYDEGYTSIGNKKNTSKNKNLMDQETKKYIPAYKAADEHERENRQKL